MTELKPCPFCGDIPRKTESLSGFDMYNVSCETDDCLGGNDIWWETEQEAIEAWNTRYEPTCIKIDDYDGAEETEDNWIGYRCSVCDHWITGFDNFCSHCGAKVIKE